MAITEARNEISRNIGELDGNGIIKIFEMSDTSLFSEISIGNLDSVIRRCCTRSRL